jgi:hypothetical protein
MKSFRRSDTERYYCSCIFQVHRGNTQMVGRVLTKLI